MNSWWLCLKVRAKREDDGTEKAVLREKVILVGDTDEGDAAGFAAAGVCPFGNIKYVTNNYTNMALRTIEGMVKDSNEIIRQFSMVPVEIVIRNSTQPTQ